MSKIEIINGKTYRIPDNATPEMIAKFKSSNVSTPEKPEQPYGMGGALRDVGAGAVDSVLGMAKAGIEPLKGTPLEGNNYLKDFDPYKALGTENKPIDTLGGALQTAGGLLPPGPGIAKGAKAASDLLHLPAAWKILTKQVKPREAAVSIQKAHDLMEKEGSALFESAKNEAKKRGANTVPVDHSFMDDIIDSGYLPNSKANQALIAKAKKGDYEDLHKVQSSLWQKAKKALGSDDLSQNNFGELISEKRNELNDIIHGHFKNTGHEDISDMIKEGSDKWRNLKETYYNHPTMARMVDSDAGRIIPKNPMTMLTEDSDRMRSFLSKHPEINEKVNLYNQKNALQSVLKKLGYGVAGVGATDLGLHGARALKDKLLEE